MSGDVKLTARQWRILRAVSAESCLPWTLSDILDDDVSALISAGYVQTYWGMGGTHWTVTYDGRAALARHDAPADDERDGGHGA